MNKYEAAYNLMMIISVADGEFAEAEGRVIIDFLKQMHESYVGTKEENRLFSELSNHQLIEHFRESGYQFFRENTADKRTEIFRNIATEFGQISSDEEKSSCIEYIKRVILADHKITEVENNYINLLFSTWGLE